MAITTPQLKRASGGARFITLEATGEYSLGNAAEESVGSMKLTFVGASWNGSVQIQGRHHGSGLTAGVAIPYRRLHVGGTASDNTYVSAAITADAKIVVEGDGDDVILNYTHTSGTCDVYIAPLKG